MNKEDLADWICGIAYRKLRYVGGKPSAQQLKKWIEEGEMAGEMKGGKYVVDL